MRAIHPLLLLVLGIYLHGVCGAQPAQIRLSPPLLTGCTEDGLAQAQVIWSAPGVVGPVQVTVLDSGASNALTGPSLPNGTAITGNWVRNGLVFSLRDAQGVELARTRAQVLCSAQPPSLYAALANSTYFPLQVGNQWVYRVNSRTGTSNYVSRQVARLEVIKGQSWYAVTDLLSTADAPSVSYFRADSAGRIYLLVTAGDGSQRDQLYLDPAQTAGQGTGATYPVQSRGALFQKHSVPSVTR